MNYQSERSTAFRTSASSSADASSVPEVVIALALLDLLERTRAPMCPDDIAAALNIGACSTRVLCEEMLSKDYLQLSIDGRVFLGPSVVRLARATDR
jgi:DNA-binding IclR family transcriptional regulator